MNAFWVMNTRDSHAGKPINMIIWVFLSMPNMDAFNRKNKGRTRVSRAMLKLLLGRDSYASGVICKLGKQMGCDYLGRRRFVHHEYIPTDRQETVCSTPSSGWFAV